MNDSSDLPIWISELKTMESEVYLVTRLNMTPYSRTQFVQLNGFASNKMVATYSIFHTNNVYEKLKFSFFVVDDTDILTNG